MYRNNLIHFEDKKSLEIIYKKSLMINYNAEVLL